MHRFFVENRRSHFVFLLMRQSVARGLELFGEIGCDTILFNSVISACGKSGQWQIALELMQLTLHQAKVFRENDSNPFPLLLNVPHILKAWGEGHLV